MVLGEKNDPIFYNLKLLNGMGGPMVVKSLELTLGGLFKGDMESRNFLFLIPIKHVFL